LHEDAVDAVYVLFFGLEVPNFATAAGREQGAAVVGDAGERTGCKAEGAQPLTKWRVRSLGQAAKAQRLPVVTGARSW
jgi:hypothetical protein